MIRHRIWTGGLIAAMILTGSQTSALAQSKPLVLGTPGIPPIFVAVIALVASKQGFFKKFGVDVGVKDFESGTAAARALVAGDIDLAMAPTPLVTAQISNANVDIVGIYGFPTPDFLIASTDPKKATCKDMIGQPVGVDAIGGARAVALKSMLAACGVRLDQVQQIVLPSVATQQAMIAGRITFGVIHIDEIPVLEQHGKPIVEVTSIAKSSPNSHFVMIAVRRPDLAAHRDAFVRTVAALVGAARFMRDPKNLERVAEIATATGRTKDEAEGAIKRFNAIDYWPVDSDGLDRKKLDSVVATQKENGGIAPGKTPVTYERLVDRSVWKDAMALVTKAP